MKILQGNIWAHLRQGYKVVVTTNIGWGTAHGANDRRARNNMGAGLAWQAAKYFPELPLWYAETLRGILGMGPGAPVVSRGYTKEQLYVPPVEHPRYPLIFLPVKGMHPDGPHLSWAQEANLELIEAGLIRLAAHQGEIALTFPGCGNGGLLPSQVLPLLSKHLEADRFVVVDQQVGTPTVEQLAAEAEARGVFDLLEEPPQAEPSPVLH